ncbi:MAG: YkgJ family cysteine cluster protein [Elusimicrobiota bacterium]
MEEIQRLKEEILKEYPRLTKDSEFTFACHKDVSCFNNCCGDVNIFLTPYDILRFKKALGITSGEFLEKYTISPFDKNLKYPIVLLKMRDDEKKTCQFVTKDGCGVYADRPWSCRMYPLGLASPKEDSEALNKEFYFLLKETGCKGFDETRKWTVSEWLREQGIAEYDEMGKEFKDITLHKLVQEGGILTPQKIEMFFMACYDLDKFRGFVFKSSFFDKFVVDEETREALKKDDTALLKFGYRWLRFALLGEKTMTVEAEVMEAKKKELEAKKKAAEEAAEAREAAAKVDPTDKMNPKMN